MNEVAIPLICITLLRASSADIKLFFPKNGQQPTTEQATIWSCANVDDSAVTQWYMYVFTRVGLLDGKPIITTQGDRDSQLFTENFEIGF
jgi:hypothetical protein